MAVQVVTGETRAEFMAARVKNVPEKLVEPPKVEVKEAPKTDPEPVVAPKDAKEEPAEQPKEKESEVKEGERARLKAERQKAREEAEEARKELEKVKKELDEAKKPPAKDQGKPDPTKYTDMALYAEALADWKLDQKWKEREIKENEARVKAAQEQVLKTWQQRVKAAAKEIPDYQEVIAEANDIPLSNELRDLILESEHGPNLQYYLAKNPEEVDRLHKMTVRGLGVAIGKLEAQIEAEQAKKQSQPAQPLPKVPLRKEAPEPITPIGSAGTPSSGVVDANGNVTGSFKDYKAARLAGRIR